MVKNPIHDQFMIIHNNLLSSGLSANAIAVYLHLYASDELIDVRKITSLLHITCAEFDSAMDELFSSYWITQDIDSNITISDNPFKD